MRLALSTFDILKCEAVLSRKADKAMEERAELA
jgi:hypothetical protein